MLKSILTNKYVNRFVNHMNMVNKLVNKLHETQKKLSLQKSRTNAIYSELQESEMYYKTQIKQYKQKIAELEDQISRKVAVYA